LIRSSLSPPRPTTDIKDYELKVSKDIIKKLDHCPINHLAIEHKPRNNLSLRFSTSAYELLNTLLYELLEQILETKNLAIVVEKGTDKKNEDVESRYRLVSKLKNDKAGYQVKFTIH
jgi:histone H3/H4